MSLFECAGYPSKLTSYDTKTSTVKKLTQSGLDITKTTQALFLFLLIITNEPHVTLQYIFLLQL